MYNRDAVLKVAVGEANRHLVWAPGAEATKYTKPFSGIFGSGRFSWCGAFQRWCIEASGCPIGIRAAKPMPGYEGYTFALVEYWQQWAMHNGLYHHNNAQYAPKPGDQIIFDWNGIKSDSGWDDHIGMVVANLGHGYVKTAEGNTGNMTAIKTRSLSLINGFISIPDGFVI